MKEEIHLQRKTVLLNNGDNYVVREIDQWLRFLNSYNHLWEINILLLTFPLFLSIAMFENCFDKSISLSSEHMALKLWI